MGGAYNHLSGEGAVRRMRPTGTALTWFCPASDMCSPSCEAQRGHVLHGPGLGSLGQHVMLYSFVSTLGDELN